LLTQAGYVCAIVEPSVVEIAEPWLTARELTTCNATRKALAVARVTPHAVVLAADTLVALDGDIIGKPANLAEAANFIRRLSGQAHEVWTAVFICDSRRGEARGFSEMSRVFFRKLSEVDIATYLAKISPLDKAGAYAAQGHGAEIIDRIEGSYSNVVGLPMEKTTRVLRLLGIVPRPQTVSGTSGATTAGE
jgi:septum formation protein